MKRRIPNHVADPLQDLGVAVQLPQGVGDEGLGDDDEQQPYVGAQSGGRPVIDRLQAGEERRFFVQPGAYALLCSTCEMKPVAAIEW